MSKTHKMELPRGLMMTSLDRCSHVQIKAVAIFIREHGQPSYINSFDSSAALHIDIGQRSWRIGFGGAVRETTDDLDAEVLF